MNGHELRKKRQAVFLFIALYVLGFAGFLALQSFSGGHSGLLWADYLLAAFLPFIALAYPVYHVFFIKRFEN